MIAWINAEGPDGLRDRKAPGPTPAVHGVVRWRITDLGQWLWEAFRVSVSPQAMSRVLRGMGLHKLSARPTHHAQAEGAIAAFKKSSQPRWQVSRSTRASRPSLSRYGSPMRPA